MNRSLALSLLLVSGAALLAGASTAPTPPAAPRKDHVQTWHGEAVNDPWFWLREKENPEVRKYLEAENAYTAAVTAPIAPFAAALYDEMLGRIQQTDLSVPQRRGAFCYYRKTVKGLQYPILARRAAEKDGSCGETAPEQVMLDLNELARGKPFISLGASSVSDDGKRLLYATDETGRIVACSETRKLAMEGFTFRDLGEQSAKGFDRPDHVYALTGER